MIPLQIPESLYQQIQQDAAKRNRPVEEEIIERLITPSSGEPLPSVGSAGWGQMNQRRGELIHKKYRDGLTPPEEQEYERLQGWVGAMIEIKFPGPVIDEERLNRLEARAKARAEGMPVP